MIGPLRDYSVTPGKLRAVVTRILEIAEPLSLQRFAESLVEDTLPDRFCLFTFDDGFRDTLEVAEPILSSLGVPFSIFVTTGFLDRTCYPMEIELGRFFESQVLFVGWGIRSQVRRLKQKITADPERFYDHKRTQLKGASSDERTVALKALPDFELGRSFELFLNWDELRGIAQAPNISIGAHGHGHLDLTQVTIEEATREILMPKKLLEKEVGISPLAYCYPYGAEQRIHRKIVEEAGFQIAFGTKPQLINPKEMNHFQLPRVDISDSSSLDRELKRLGNP